MKYMITLNGKNYEVEVERGQATVLSTTQAAATLQAAPAPAPAAAPAPVPAPAPAAAPAPAGNLSGEVIKAPMPGTILAVKASVGASVKRGETLLILEAMKMENEISAPRDGVVSGISVTKGASVSTGDALVSLK